MEQLADSISSMQKKSNENSGLVWFGVVLAVLIGLIAIFVMGWKWAKIINSVQFVFRKYVILGGKQHFYLQLQFVIIIYLFVEL